VTTYAVGDVQGCYRSLRALLERIGFEPRSDELWFVGDLVNRGPNSLEVLRFIRSLGERAITVLGNHDLHLLAVREEPTRARRGDTLSPVLAAPDCDLLVDWLATRPLLHRDEATGFVMTHAGIPAIWSIDEAAARAREVESVLQGRGRSEFLRAMYGNEPAEWRADLEGQDRLRVITNYFTRMRGLRGSAALDLSFKETPGALPKGTRPWYEDYRVQPCPMKLVFGHWAALGGRCDVPGIFALDTGCVWGGKLSALRLVDQERFSVASVE